MKTALRLLLVLFAVSVCVPSSLWAADLFGTSVNGSLQFNNGGPNYFDAANGYVPAGYGNSGSPNGIIISDWLEFAFYDNANYITVNFTHTDLIVSVFSIYGNLTNSTFTFQDSAFQTLTLDSENFPGGASASLAGDIITVNVTQFVAGTGLYQGDWKINATVVPEPGTMVTLGSGLLGVVAFARRRWLS